MGNATLQLAGLIKGGIFIVNCVRINKMCLIYLKERVEIDSQLIISEEFNRKNLSQFVQHFLHIFC